MSQKFEIFQNFCSPNNIGISVIREPSFLIVTNPVKKYHPMQMNFLGKQTNRHIGSMIWT